MALRAAVGFNAGAIGSALLVGALDIAYYIARSQTWRAAGNWVQTLECAGGSGTVSWRTGAPTVCGTYFDEGPYSSPSDLIQANPNANAMMNQRPSVFVGRWNNWQSYEKPAGSAAHPLPYLDLGFTAIPAVDPAVMPRISPALIPAIDPLAVPPLSPSPSPAPVPYPMIPRLPRIDPNRDPLEQPRRGPRPAPRPRPRVRPRPRPRVDPEPQAEPVRPTVPSDVPAINIVQRPGSRPAVSPNGRHERRPPGRGERERKTNDYRRGLALINATLGGLTELADAIDALYKAIPAKYRRWKGDDGKWREREITPQGKARFLYKNLQHVDLGKALQNLVENEVEDRAVALPGQLFPNKSGLHGTGIPGH